MDIFCLYTVCWDVLTATVDKFRNGWNNHLISTAENFSPSQLFVMGLMKLKNSGEYHPELNQVIWFKIQLYCISWYLLNLIFFAQDHSSVCFAALLLKLIFLSSFTAAGYRESAVNVHSFHSPLNEIQTQQLYSQFDPSSVTLQNLADTYISVKNFVLSCILQ